MAHYARVEDGIVTDVLVVPDEHEHDGEYFLNSIGLSGVWVQTSYNTRGNVHYGSDGTPDGGEPLRFNYAGVGFLYDEFRDGFIPPLPKGDGWVLDELTLTWVKN